MITVVADCRLNDVFSLRRGTIIEYCSSMPRYVKISLKVLSAFIIILLLLWTGIYIYFRANKADLLVKVQQTVSERLRGQAQIQDIGLNFLTNFPHITLRLDNVSLRDSMYPVHKRDLLKARKLFVSAATLPLLGGKVQLSKIVIENGQLYLFTDANGYTNKYITSPRAGGNEQKSSHRSLPDKIVLKNMRIVMADAVKQKRHDVQVGKLQCKIASSGGYLFFGLDLNATINGLGFNLDKGSYAKGKTIRGDFTLRFDTLQRVLTAKDARLKIGGQPFLLNAGFHFDESRAFSLDLRTSRAPFRAVAEMLSGHIRKKLDSIDFARPVTLAAIIKGRTVYRDTPRVDVSMTVKDNVLTTPRGVFEGCSFSGVFTNHASDTLSRTDQNSAITVSGLTTHWEGVPIASEKVYILNLLNPILTCDIQSNTPLSKVDELVGSESFHFISGEARTKIYYHGPAGQTNDTAAISPYISGSFSFANAELEYIPRGLKLTGFNGDIIFDSSDIRMKEMKGKVQGSPIEINAEIKNFFALMNIDPGKLELTSRIYMPEININEFKSFLGQRTRPARQRRTSKLASLSRSIDKFMDVCNMNTSLRSDKVTYKRFVATGVKANVLMANDTWKFNNVSLNHADGNLDMDCALENVQGNASRLSVQASLRNINISRLFYAFNNFGLRDISSENIRGMLTTSINLSGLLNNDASLDASTLNGTIDLSLKKGELINFEPLQKMSVFLLKKRDFSNLEFAELKNRFELNGNTIVINRMEVQSTALSMYVEGLYDLKGEQTDLVVQVPLSNLKKRKPDYVPENKGVDAKTGMSVYVRATSGKGDDIDFKIGLFKKKSVLEKRKKAADSIP